MCCVCECVKSCTRDDVNAGVPAIYMCVHIFMPGGVAGKCSDNCTVPSNEVMN